jgi:hypothetical protein
MGAAWSRHAMCESAFKVLERQRESISKYSSSEIPVIGKYDGCVTARSIDVFRLLRNDRRFLVITASWHSFCNHNKYQMEKE